MAKTPGAEHLTVDSWILWAVGMLSVVARLVSRSLALGGWRKYQLDDYLMMLCAIFFTGIVVTSNQVKKNDSNYATDDIIAAMTDQDIDNAIWGSKMLLVLEQCSLATLWLVKACLLLLYARLTSGLAEGYAVKAVGVYCAIGYLTIQILYFGVWCRPLHMYWSIPVPIGHEQCRTYFNHMVTVTVFHVSSDLLMLLIPVPMIARTRMPIVRKVILVVVFSLGLLVVLVAILNRYYNFTIVNSYVFLVWYNGEASTAVMIANIPFFWTLLRHIFSLDAWSSTSRGRDPAGAQRLDDNYPNPPLGSGSGSGNGPRTQLSNLRHHQRVQSQQALNKKALAASQKFFASNSATSTKLNSKAATSTKHSSIGIDPFLSASTERITEDGNSGTTLQRRNSTPGSTSDSVPDATKHGDLEMVPPTRPPLYHRNIGGDSSASSDRDVELGL